jgi:ABC-type anion transport system duplicated permease subunit
MATCTIVLTSNADGSVDALCSTTAGISWGQHVVNCTTSAGQTKRLVQGLKSVIATVLSLPE